MGRLILEIAISVALAFCLCYPIAKALKAGEDEGLMDRGYAGERDDADKNDI